MTRALRTLVHNWPLKLGAVILATLLYGGLVLSQSARTYRNAIPIEPVNMAADLYVVSDLGAVTSIQYIVPEDLGLRIGASSFHPTVDFDGVDPSGGAVSLAVRITTSDPRIQVLDFEPHRISVEVDRVTSRDVPVRVEVLNTPSGFDLGDPVADVTTATVSGPESVVSKVAVHTLC